ncbi:F-box/LRR-repeat protein At3g58900-like [Papaver somniferum]|uniref:F-box/LRR-repeat protein At3g58900-like n=1 Tax=Papaver somniferum TaxID=3469 RepID=UPI000E6FAA81|nr:F-box/LRR-repeat protein At3g58900-like [Papaver somniferum]
MIGKAEDRISNLPDSLVYHILSFLETKDVARTCVLSHRWNHIWTSFPNLEFVWDGWSKPRYLTDKFIDYADGTVRRRCLSDNDIHKFHITTSEHLDETLVKSWISEVVRHNVKDFSLFLCANDPSCIPQSIFTCASLTSFQLTFFPGDIDFPEYISFPRLKHLRLEHIEVTNQCWCKKVFPNCPVLEELYLENCQFSEPSFCISIPTIKILSIDHCHGLDESALKIQAPRLMTFYYTGYVAKEYIFSSFLTLEEAVVYLYAPCPMEDKAHYAEVVRQFLRDLTHVKCLTVKNPPYQAKYLPGNSPVYHNIKQLKITQGVTSDAAVIAFLKVTPNLESLVIEKREPYCVNVCDHKNHDNEDDGLTLDMLDTGCLFLHLKSVCFMPIIWGPKEIRFLKVILRNARALQSLTVYHDNSRRPLKVAELELMVQIQSFPRASESCTFKISLGSQ